MTFEMTTPMEEMPFYCLNSGGDEICFAENERYVAKIVLCESASPTYITYKGKQYDLECVHGDDYKKLFPQEALEYIRTHEYWLDSQDFGDWSLGNDPDLMIYDKELDDWVQSECHGDVAAEIEWDDKKITEEDFRAFMKFALDHPLAFKDDDNRFDITGWADGNKEKWFEVA